MQIDTASAESLRAREAELSEQYQQFQAAGLSLDLTRGKPSSDQLDLAAGMDSILAGDLTSPSGEDLRNYGNLLGIKEARALFSEMIGVSPEETIVGGNSSLSLMYQAVMFSMYMGFGELGKPWSETMKSSVKFLAPVPGYDRHFSVCEHLGIELVPVAMNDDGPDMDEVERLIKADSDIRGIWCVPRFSNPTGTVYSEAVVRRIAQLGKIAGDNFRVFWDNAYAVHIIEDNAPALTNLMDICREEGTENSAYIFGSTSKISYAGAGVAFVGMSEANIQGFVKHLGMTQIGADKINQMRHVRFFVDMDGIKAHMDKHAALLKPRFDIVLKYLEQDLADTGMGAWTRPEGGYFVSFDTRPGLAREVVKLAADAGVKLTPAGATFPYGKDPEDRNIRIAPSVPSLEEIDQAMQVFTCCVQLASVRQALSA